MHPVRQESAVSILAAGCQSSVHGDLRSKQRGQVGSGLCDLADTKLLALVAGSKVTCAYQSGDFLICGRRVKIRTPPGGMGGENKTLRCSWG